MRELKIYDNEVYAVEISIVKCADDITRDRLSVWFHDLPIRRTDIISDSCPTGHGKEVIGRSIGDSLIETYNLGLTRGTERARQRIKKALGIKS